MYIIEAKFRKENRMIAEKTAKYLTTHKLAGNVEIHEEIIDKTEIIVLNALTTITDFAIGAIEMYSPTEHPDISITPFIGNTKLKYSVFNQLKINTPI